MQSTAQKYLDVYEPIKVMSQLRLGETSIRWKGLLLSANLSFLNFSD